MGVIGEQLGEGGKGGVIAFVDAGVQPDRARGREGDGLRSGDGGGSPGERLWGYGERVECVVELYDLAVFFPPLRNEAG